MTGTEHPELWLSVPVGHDGSLFQDCSSKQAAFAKPAASQLHLTVGSNPIFGVFVMLLWRLTFAGKRVVSSEAQREAHGKMPKWA